MISLYCVIFTERKQGCFMHATTAATVSINLDALNHNFLAIKKLMPHQKILAMIKSNAYGHGVVPIAKTLLQADALGVATISEALQLREENINNKIIVMRGFLNKTELQVFLNDPSIIASVYNIKQVELLEKHTNQNKKISIWLKLDTGMNRLGISPDEFPKIYDRLEKINGLQKPFVLFSHLADADNADKKFTENQISLFDRLTKHLPGEKSLLNSAGILAYPKNHYDWIRPGLLLYGAMPFETFQAGNFKPVMNLQANIIAIKNVNKYDKIGYSCIYTAEKNMKIAIICAGYGDGYPRNAKAGTPVLIRGERCPLVGRVSMDMLAVDVSNLKSAEIGDVATLWGDNLPVELIAQYSDTISYELLTRMTPRVEYRYE